jgi:hypothetical protein
MASINTQVRQVSGLLDTKDLSDWEHDFVSSITQQTKDGNNTSSLTDKQIECLERIHGKHFAN